MVEEVQEIVEEESSKVPVAVQNIENPVTESKSKKSKKNKKKDNTTPVAVQEFPAQVEFVKPIEKDETIEDLSVRTDSGIVDPPSELSSSAPAVSGSTKKKSRSKKNKDKKAPAPPSSEPVQESQPAVSEPVAVEKQPPAASNESSTKSRDSKKKKSKNSSESKKENEEKVQILENFTNCFFDEFFLVAVVDNFLSFSHTIFFSHSSRSHDIHVNYNLLLVSQSAAHFRIFSFVFLRVLFSFFSFVIIFAWKDII